MERAQERLHEWYIAVLAHLSRRLAEQQDRCDWTAARATSHVLCFLRIIPPERAACLAGAFALMRREEAWRFASERGYRWQLMRAMQRLAQQSADSAVNPRWPQYLPQRAVAVLEATADLLTACFESLMQRAVARHLEVTAGVLKSA